METTCMGCYMKEMAENESGDRFPGTSVSLMKTGTTANAKYRMALRKGLGSGG